MSYPILYSATETNFDHNGMGILSSCISCDITEEANGMFELSMLYPMDGVHFHGISDRSIIKAKPDKFREPQLFRVYAISKPMSGIVSVFAEHISYELCGIPVSPFSASNVVSALQGLKDNAVVDCPFDFWTDKSTEAEFATSVPASIRSRLGGSSGSILDIYAGEYEFDNYTVKLHNNRGMNRGVSIRYGKNLTNIQQDQNCSNVATGIYPYWAGNIDGSDIFVQLPEKIINAPGTYNFVKIKTIDFSKQFETQPSEEQLRTAAENYIKNNNIGVPDVSLTVSFAQLEQSDEYKGMKLLERVSLFDDVNVVFPDLGVSATAKAVKLVYDVIADRVKTVALGSVRTSIADTIVEQQKEIEKAPTITDLERAKAAATAWLTNGKGYKVERVDANGNTIDTLYMDTPDINTAVNVLRIGQSGIGFSHNGVNGPYNSAWTIDGNFVADFITSGVLNAAKVKVVNLDASNINSGKLKSEFIDAVGLTAERIESSLENGERMVAGGASIMFTMPDGSAGEVGSDGINYISSGTIVDGKNVPSLGVHMNTFNGRLSIGNTTCCKLWTYDKSAGHYYIEMPEYRWGYGSGVEWINDKCHFEYVKSIGKTVLVRDD